MPLKVLIVDDARRARAVLRRALASIDPMVVIAEAGDRDAALELQRRRGFDLVFVDLDMPSGRETLAALRAWDPDALLVAVSDAAGASRPRATGMKADQVLDRPFNTGALEQLLAARAHPAGTRALGVLIVDDSRSIRAILRRTLEESGVPCRIALAADGREALELAGRRRLDLVLMDVDLPRADGFTVMRELTRLHPTAEVVVVSADRREGSVREAIALGASRYVAKPFSRDQIAALLPKPAAGRAA
jgi:two-component system, NtrC family, sensor kinase